METESSSTVKVFYPQFDSQQIVQAIEARIDALAGLLPIKLVALFGSYAKGNYTVASDVDLLIIYRGETRQDACKIVRKTLPIPRLEPHTYSETEYDRHKRVVDRMMKEAKVIYQAQT